MPTRSWPDFSSRRRGWPSSTGSWARLTSPSICVGSSGVRLMSLFLLLSRLDRVVAASKTAQHETAVQMEQVIEQFGGSERERLAVGMAPKRICVCQDETFHRGQMCLVAMEPLSGFLLVEQHSPKRDEPSWTEAMKSALSGLEVEVEELVSDEARGLLSHARDGLGVHPRPGAVPHPA
jgi:hypothetical protein